MAKNRRERQCVAAIPAPRGAAARLLWSLMPLDPTFFLRPAANVARDLIGATLLVDGVGGIIVETEAYAPDDPASHAFRGPTPRNAAMFREGGIAYVYRSYGIHWCLNFVTGAEGHGAAVLIRALEPTAGLDVMAARRGVVPPLLLAAGPGRLCQALAIDGRADGLSLSAPPFQLDPATIAPAITTGPRIGITKGVDTPWRFWAAGSRYVSR